MLRLEASCADLAATPAEARDFTTTPTLPPWEECLDLHEGAVGGDAMSVVDRVRIGVAEIPGWRRGTPSGEPGAEFWFGFADGSDPALWSLAFVVDGGAPVVLELGVGSSTAQMTVHFREHPAPGPLACRTVTRHVAHGLHEEDVEVFDAAGTLVAQSRQLALVV